MKKDESFFINLFKLKSKKDSGSREEVDEIKDKNSVANEVENEWIQEYMVIYQSYSFE
jgi:hypothetical protein